MIQSVGMTPDPQLDLVIERLVEVPRVSIWNAWTKPEHVKQWFAPAPWSVVECEIDLHPGGIFRTLLRSPEGAESPNVGCYLQILTGHRLVWTTALSPGFRPATAPLLPITVAVTLEDEESGTRYVAIAMHGDESVRKRHEELGFYEGWGKALDQLIAYAGGL
jgi:uncharacterized protein YndB with AHSA1/START domain